MAVLLPVGVWLLTVILVEMDGVNGSLQPETVRCELLKIPLCRSHVPYNYTMMPNRFHHETQDEAGLEVHQFIPLVHTKCSPELAKFLCSMYAPICMENFHRPIPVCRSVCLRTRAACEPVMAQYGFEWPERMQCEQFPEYKEDGDPENLCMDWLNGSVPDQPEARPVPPPRSGGSTKSTKTPISSSFPPPVVATCPPCSCPKDLSVPAIDGTSFAGLAGCASPCRSPFPSRNEWMIIEYWIGGWSVLCFALTFLSVLTFLLDRKRFLYPERPVVLITGCYLMVSLGFVLRLYFGHSDVSCSGGASRHGDISSWKCTVIFVLLYFFGMASCIWWVILSFTWYLSTGRKWTTEALAAHWKWFHLAAWGLPLGFTAVVLGTHSVDGDPVAGVCYVGMHDPNDLLVFVTAPLAVYLVIGAGFILLGMCSLWGAHSQKGRLISLSDKEEHQRFHHQMNRIGAFAICTFVHFATFLGCTIYEMLYREDWERTTLCNCKGSGSQPNVSVLYIIKYLAMLVVGVISVGWFLNLKTVKSWGFVCCGSRAKAQQVIAKADEYTLTKSTDPFLRLQCKYSLNAV
ncbi:frizzled-5-like [Paramacrobiotus metropolitanus]|uniref:frizzled-5-like n=1 Tax=Paramacrobiotus metropolitanus TaxID=2943436 RepID=UPI002445EFD3|nr:frizzled-5-like [Paramacrobiotus metropolitanus]